MFDDRIQGIDAMGARLNAAFLAEEAAAESGKRKPRRKWFVAAAGLAATAAAVLLLAGVFSGDQSLDVDTAIADVANRLEIAPQPRPDQFGYSKTRYSGIGSIADKVDSRDRPIDGFLIKSQGYGETWASVEHGMAVLRHSEVATFPTDQDAERGASSRKSANEVTELAKTAAGRRELGGARGTQKALAMSSQFRPQVERLRYGSDGMYTVGFEQVTQAQMKEYPRDPQAIYDRVMDLLDGPQEDPNPDYSPQVHWTPDDGMWTVITGFLNENAPLPVEIRAGFIKALALVPGVGYEGEGTDAFGRKGYKFSRTSGGIRSDVLFDAETSVVLRTSDTIVAPEQLNPRFRHLPAGTTLHSFELVDAKTVDEIPADVAKQLPAGPEGGR